MTALVGAWAWIAGMVAGTRLDLGAGPVALAVLASIAGVAAIVAGPGPARAVGVATTAVLLGATRALLAPAVVPPPELVGLPDDATLVGVVSDAPLDEGRRARFPLELVQIEQAGDDAPRPVAGRVLVLAEVGAVGYGDLIGVRGRVSAPRSRAGFPRAQILAARGIALTVTASSVEIRDPAGPSVTSALHAIRAQLERAVREAMPDPQSSLTAGIVLGTRSTIPTELRSALAMTGTSHVVAVSGFNVAVLAGAVQFVAVRFVGRPWAYLPMFALTWAYTALVGSPPSAVRAAAMASLVFLAQAVGRLPDPMTVLSLAAAGLLAFDPRLQGDLGFQLSVAATIGLILFARPLSDRLSPLPPLVREGVAVAVAAQAATLPIALATFHTLPVVAPLANLLIGFAIPALMLVGGLLALLGPLPGLGELLAWGAWGIATYVVWVVEWCASLPGAVLYTGRLPPLLGVAWLAALGLWAALGSSDLRPSWTNRIPRAALGACPLLLLPLTALASPSASGTTIHLLNSGGSDALVRTEDGRTLLLSDGRSTSALAAAVADELDFWQPRLDVAIHTGSGSVGRSGIAETTRRYPVDLTVAATMRAAGDGDTEPIRALDAAPDLTIELGNGVIARVVDVRGQDDRSTIDVELVTPSVSVWVPGSGPPSPRWREIVTDDRLVVVRFAAVRRDWQALLAELPVSLIVTDKPLVIEHRLVLDHQSYGTVELRDDGNRLTIVVERCPLADRCSVELP